MADSQNLPVFLRFIDDADPQFLGRFALGELDELVRVIKMHGCYCGEHDVATDATTQFICYQSGLRGPWISGFEIILESSD